MRHPGLGRGYHAGRSRLELSPTERALLADPPEQQLRQTIAWYAVPPALRAQLAGAEADVGRIARFLDERPSPPPVPPPASRGIMPDRPPVRSAHRSWWRRLFGG